MLSGALMASEAYRHGNGRAEKALRNKSGNNSITSTTAARPNVHSADNNEILPNPEGDQAPPSKLVRKK